MNVISRTLSNDYLLNSDQAVISDQWPLKGILWTVTEDLSSADSEQTVTLYQWPWGNQWKVWPFTREKYLVTSDQWPSSLAIDQWPIDKWPVTSVSRDFSDWWPMTRDNFHAISDQWTVNDNQWQVANDSSSAASERTNEECDQFPVIMCLVTNGTC